MVDLLNSRRLQHFLAVYEHRSFGRAAAEVNVTQPALSKSIQLLEEELGVKLFERTASGVTPTIYGDALAEHAKIIQAEMRNAAREIATMSGAQIGEVRVGGTPSVTGSLLPAVFLKLQKARPGIRLRVTEGLMEDHIPALRRGELDVFIGGWVSGLHPDLTTELLLSDEVGVFAGPEHPLADAASLGLEDLLAFPWALPPQSQFWLDMVQKAFMQRGLQPPKAAAVTNSAGFLRGLLQDNRFLSVLPVRLMRDELTRGHVAALSVPDLKITIEITATYRRQAIRLSAFELFMNVLRRIAQTEEEALRARPAKPR